MTSVLQRLLGDGKGLLVHECCLMKPKIMRYRKVRWLNYSSPEAGSPRKLRILVRRARVPRALLIINILISLMVLNNSFQALFSTYRGTFFWKKRVYSLQWVGNLTCQRNISWDLWKHSRSWEKKAPLTHWLTKEIHTQSQKRFEEYLLNLRLLTILRTLFFN